MSTNAQTAPAVNPAPQAQKPWAEMSEEEKLQSHREQIAEMPRGFRELYSLVLFCRGAQMCSTAIRLRAYLCSLYNGNAARKVDLSDVQCFDSGIRKHFVEVVATIGDGSSGLYDYHIREAFERLGMKRFFDEGFPRRRAR